jgi:hypothetical protein
MDLGFEQLLAEHQQEFKDADVFSNWMPRDGIYEVVSITKFESGRKSKDGTDVAWWKLTGQVEDVVSEYNGKEFTVGFYRSSAYGILKGAARVLSDNPQLEDLKEAHVILEASVGKVIRVEVRTSRSKKDGKDYTNCYILEVIHTTTETSAEDVSNAETPAEAPAEVPTEVPTA